MKSHFTGEEYAESTRRLRDLREDVVEAVRASPPRGADARDDLGAALHTIQDFYSHSNWVERDHGSINESLGRSLLTDPPTTSQPCPDNPNQLGSAGGGSDTTAYFSDPTGCLLLPYEGKCFHGNYTMSCIGINKDLDAIEAAGEGVPGVALPRGGARSR